MMRYGVLVGRTDTLRQVPNGTAMANPTTQKTHAKRSVPIKDPQGPSRTLKGLKAANNATESVILRMLEDGHVGRSF